MKEAYKRRGWDPYFVSAFAPVCNANRTIRYGGAHPGCMLWGALHVNQVAGDVHIATRTGLVNMQGFPVYDNDIIHSLSSSHYIQQWQQCAAVMCSFSFGDHIPGVHYPLDARSFHSRSRSLPIDASHVVSSHNYYIEVLPSVYVKEDLRMESNEVSMCPFRHP